MKCTNNDNGAVHPSKIKEMKKYLDDYMRIKGRALREKNTYFCVLHDEKEPSLKSYWSHKDPSTGVRKAKCFSCGASFDVYDLVGVLEGVEGLKEQYYRLCEVLGENVKTEEQKEMAANPSKQKLTVKEVEAYLSDCNQMAGIPFWKERGIKEKTILEYKLTYDEIKKALVIPFGKEGYVQRYLQHSSYRYIKSLGLRDYFRSHNMNKKLPIILTEGEIDALSIIEAGYPNVISLGSIVNLINVYEGIVATTDLDVIVAVDLDPAGQKWQQDLIDTCVTIGWRKPISLWDCMRQPIDISCKDINDYLIQHRSILEDCLSGLKHLYGGSDEEINR